MALSQQGIWLPQGLTLNNNAAKKETLVLPKAM
jgi:hypothetical protein